MDSEYVVASVKSHGLECATFVDVLRQQAEENPDRIAYTFLGERGPEGSDVTFAELERNALAIAAFLQSLGFQGERVLLLLPTGADYVRAFFGCLYAGAIAIPAFPPHGGNVRKGESWFQTVARDATPLLAFTAPEIIDRLPNQLMQQAGIRPVTLGEIDPAMAADWCPPEINAESIAFLQYTSGSTSVPKGVMVCHGNLLDNMKVIRTVCGNDQESTVVSWLPLHHDMGLIGAVLHPAYLGARSVLLSPARFMHSPVSWLAAITRFRGRSSSAPNFAYDICAQKIKPEQKIDLDLSSWQVAVNGAEPVRAQTMEQFTAAFAHCGFRAEAFLPCYGLAESTLMVTGKRTSTQTVVKGVSARAMQQHRVCKPLGDEDSRLLVGCGGALSEHEVRIVEPETRMLCDEDAIGEIWVGGPSVAQGYWNRREESASTFRARLCPDERGPFLRTGDLGFFSEGQLFISGRRKDLIIIRGRNLYPQDIELTAHLVDHNLRPGAGAVFVVEVGGEQNLVLANEIERHAQIEPEKLMAVVRAAVLLEHGVALQTVVLVRNGTIPKTTSGKIKRFACRELFLSGELAVVAQSVLQRSATGKSGCTVPLSRDEILHTEPELRHELVQSMLRELAAQLLKVNVAGISCDQPLVALGLDSLLAAEFKFQIEAGFGTCLNALELLQGATLAGLSAEILDDLNAEATAASVKQEAPASDRQPLSYGQKGLWVLHRVVSESTAYTLASAARTTSVVDAAALKLAFQALMARHPMLRTIFPVYEGEPYQTILAPEKLLPERHFSYLDLSKSTAFNLSELLSAEVQRPFALDRDPPIRLLLFKLSSQEHVLMLVLHHIIADLAALETLLQEFAQLFAMHSRGEFVSLPEVAASFADFVHWQAETVQGDEGAKQLQYWSTSLGGELPILQMPGARPRSKAPTFRGASVPFNLDGETLQQLELIAREAQVTLFVVLAAIFQLSLHRATGQPDLLLGTPASGRTRTEFARVIGYCVNPIVLRSQYRAGLTFTSYLEQVRQVVLEAFAHQDYPFALLVEKLHPLRDAGVPPIFQVMFVWQGLRSGQGDALAAISMGTGEVQFQLADLALSSITLETTGSQFDLTLMMAPSAHGLSGVFKYNQDLLDEAGIKGLAGQFAVLLREVVRAPGNNLAAFPLLSRSERNQLLAACGVGIASTSPVPGLVLDWFADQVRKAPEATALVSGSETLTYAQLNARSNQFARYLRKLGVATEVRVGLCLNRSLEMLVALLGVWKAGGAYVPFNPRDPVARLSTLIEQSRIAVIIAHEELVSRMPRRLPQLVLLNLDLDLIASEDDRDLDVPVDGGNLAYVIYTSGSTGQPKGVMIEHRSLMNLLGGLRQAIYNTAENQRWRVGFNAPLAFDSSVKQILALAMGHALCLVPEEARRNGEALLTHAGEMGLEMLDCTPVQAQMMIESGLLEKNSHLSLLLGGEAVPEESWRLLSKGFPGRCYNLYGPTECTVDATCCILGSRESPSIGRPLSGTRVYILDECMEIAPRRVCGEIYIGGPSVGRGYFDSPEATAEKFLPDPFGGTEGARMYRSGDQARFAQDGSIEFMGRIDRQVKVRGFRIELDEIESELKRHPGVQDAAVVVRTDASGIRQLIAFVVAEEQQPANIYRQFLAQKLPEYMIPAVVVQIPSVPISANGKRNYGALPLPETSALEQRPDFAAPQSNLEEYLAALWTRILKVEPIGIHDNFFVLGGDSLQATRLITQVQQDHPVGAPLLALFFQQPTIAALSRHVATFQLEK